MPNTKRDVADDLVRRLANHEACHQDVTIRLMLEVATLSDFPDVERLEEPDRRVRLDEAKPPQEAPLQRSSLVHEFTDARTCRAGGATPALPSPRRSRCCTAFHEIPGHSGYRFGYTAAPTSGRTNHWSTPAPVTPRDSLRHDR